MRLLNTKTLKLRLFLKDIPPYVILSHTWADDEVTFDDIDKPHANQMTGYQKIVNCCRQAISDGYEWVWIDTCCIDKRSSSELSEAINSMYQWYWRADICYAYLADTKSFNSDVDIRWFSRGWTLQELLAPEVVEFYDQDWEFLGTKNRQADKVQLATGIEKKYLLDRTIIKHASIATKFSWASARQTTRVEDMAYCLLGLVDVNMTMLYGEGTKSFHRLQLELLRTSNEHTIFAWGQEDTPNVLPGLLCPSPTYFDSSARIKSIEGNFVAEHEMTNRGLRMRLPCIRYPEGFCLAILNCQREDSLNHDSLTIWLRDIGNQQFLKANWHGKTVSAAEARTATVEVMYILAENKSKEDEANKTLRVQIGGPSKNDSSYQGRRKFKASPERRMRSVPMKWCDANDALILQETEYVGLPFQDRTRADKNLLLIFALHQGLWLKVHQTDMELAHSYLILQEILPPTGSETAGWQHVRDYYRVYLTSKTEAFFWLKTRRVDGLLTKVLKYELRDR